MLIPRPDKTTVDNSSGRSRNVWIPHFLLFLGWLSCGLNFPFDHPPWSPPSYCPLQVQYGSCHWRSNTQQQLLLCNKHCIDGSRGAAVSALWFKSCNLQSPVFPVMVLPMALLQPHHRNHSNQLLQQIATPSRNTFSVATQNMFCRARALMEGNCTKADLFLAPFREKYVYPNVSNRSHPAQLVVVRVDIIWHLTVIIRLCTLCWCWSEILPFWSRYEALILWLF